MSKLINARVNEIERDWLRLEKENKQLRADNKRLREALEEIEGMKITGVCESPKYVQAAMYHKMRKIARAALAANEGGEDGN